MSHFPKLLLIVGAILAIGGCFLPWVIGGDLVSYQHAGLVVRFDPLFLFYDNGGLPIVLLSILSLWFILSSPFRHQRAATVIGALCLAAVVAYQWVALVVAKISSTGVIGAPEPLIGLEVIALGSILVLIAAVWNSRNRFETMEL